MLALLERQKTRSEAGAAAELDTALIRVEYDLLLQERDELLRAQQQLINHLRRLTGFYDLTYDKLDLAYSESDVMGPHSELVEQLLATHPHLIQVRAKRDIVVEKISHEKALNVPDVEVEIAYARNHGSDENLVELGLSMPLNLFDRRQGSLAAYQSQLAANDELIHAVEWDLRADLEDAHSRYVSYKSTLKRLDNQTIPLSKETYRQAFDRFQAGKISVFELINTIQSHHQVVNHRLQIEFQLNQAISSLQLLTASPAVKLYESKGTTGDE